MTHVSCGPLRLLATSVGRHDFNHLLPSVKVGDLERRVETWRGFLSELDRMDREALSGADRIHADIFRGQLVSFIEDFEYGAHLIPLTADSGFHIGFAFLPSEVPLSTVADYENYIARLEAFPEYYAQQIRLFTTLDMNAEEIHQLGLAEVARIPGGAPSAAGLRI